MIVLWRFFFFLLHIYFGQIIHNKFALTACNSIKYDLTDGYMSSPERGSRGGYEDPYYSQYAPRSGSITPVIDEEIR